jgi:hypothetical protein
MLQQRHGGTILIVPEGVNWETAVRTKRYAPILPVTAVKDAGIQNIEHMSKRDQTFQKLHQGQPTPEVWMFWNDDLIRSQFASALAWLGGLTATDGMTVIRSDLTLLCFGAFFHVKDDQTYPTRVVLFDLFGEDTSQESLPLEAIGGARHQSAAVTCRNLPGAHAIVASQDGKVSSMTWDSTNNVVFSVCHLEFLLDV